MRSIFSTLYLVALLFAVVSLAGCAAPAATQDAADSGQGGAQALAPVTYVQFSFHGDVHVSGGSNPSPAAAPSATQTATQGSEQDATNTTDVDAKVPLTGGGGAADAAVEVLGGGD